MKVSELLYCITIILIVLRKYLGIIYNGILQTPSIMLELIFPMIICILMAQLITNKFKKVEIIFILIGIGIFIFKRDSSILAYLILASVSKNIDNKKIAKYFFWTNLILFPLIPLLVNMGILPQSTTLHYKLVDGISVLRKDWGFGNPNAPFFYMMPVYISYIFLRFEKYNIFDRLFLLGSSLLIYYTTYSRTGLLTIITTLILVEIFRNISLKKKIVQRSIIFIPYFFFILSFILGFYFSDNEVINKILTSRPLCWNAYIEQFGNAFTIFGNQYNAEMRTNYPLDNSYIYIQAYFGVIIWSIIALAISKGLNICVNENNKKIILVSIMIMLFSFTENMLFDAASNMPFILLIKLIYNKKVKDLNKDIYSEKVLDTNKLIEM